VLAVTLALLPRLVGWRTVEAGVEPAAPGSAVSYDDLAAALAHAGPGGVDYPSLHGDAHALRRFAATLAVTGPRSTPDLFPSRDARLAWHLNAYNALVLLGVVEAWPIASIHEVRGWLEPKAGFGFFWAQRFRLDGRRVNLFDLENKSIRGFVDARIHAALNCASASCPSLAPEPYRPETLDAQLDAAARRFTSEAPHVHVDEAARTVELSAIYDWFSGDFEQHSGALGGEPSVLAWIERYADPTTSAAVARARSEGYSVVRAPYDWSLNLRR